MINDFQKKSLRKALRARPYLVPLAKRLMSIGGDTPVVWDEDQLTSKPFVAILLLFGRVSSGNRDSLSRIQLGSVEVDHYRVNLMLACESSSGDSVS